MLNLPSFICCPTCHATLTSGSGATCERGHSFPVAQGFVDFTQTSAVDEEWSELHQHAVEAAGIRHRVEHFLLPHIRDHFGREDVRLLDDGTGLGHVVEYLREHSRVDAYGIDPGCRRKQWADRDLEGRLFGASGLALPFEDASFDVVFSSGVLEHVADGVPIGPDREPPIHAYLAEVVRVLRPGGVAWIAHPNGRHPIDYWHPIGSSGLAASLRLHSPREQWMPLPEQVLRGVAASPVEATARFVPPQGFLAFERVRAHAYGRAFSGIMQGVFRLTQASPRLFAGSWLNPWLVTEIRRTEPALVGQTTP